jgi:hypothetical protein
MLNVEKCGNIKRGVYNNLGHPSTTFSCGPLNTLCMHHGRVARKEDCEFDSILAWW